MRLCAVIMLEDAGYEVLEAANADVALEILESRSDINIVFTDVNMPGSIDGLRLAYAVRERWPPIELIVTSGRYTGQECKLPSRGRFLVKPYSDHSLMLAIEGF